MASRVSFLASEDGFVVHADEDPFRWESKYYGKPTPHSTRAKPKMNSGKHRSSTNRAKHASGAPPTTGPWWDAHHFGKGYFGSHHGEWHPNPPSRETSRKSSNPFEKTKNPGGFDRWEADDVDSLDDYSVEGDFMDDYFTSRAFEGEKHFDVPLRPDPSYAFKAGWPGSRTPYPPPPPPPPPRHSPSRFAPPGYADDYFRADDPTAPRTAPPPPPPPPGPTPGAYGTGIPSPSTASPFQPHWPWGYPRPAPQRDYRSAEMPAPFAPVFPHMRAPDPIPRPMSAFPYPGARVDAYAPYPRRAASPPPVSSFVYQELARQARSGEFEYKDLGHRFDMAGRERY